MKNEMEKFVKTYEIESDGLPLDCHRALFQACQKLEYLDYNFYLKGDEKNNKQIWQEPHLGSGLNIQITPGHNTHISISVHNTVDRLANQYGDKGKDFSEVFDPIFNRLLSAMQETLVEVTGNTNISIREKQLIRRIIPELDISREILGADFVGRVVRPTMDELIPNADYFDRMGAFNLGLAVRIFNKEGLKPIYPCVELPDYLTGFLENAVSSAKRMVTDFVLEKFSKDYSDLDLYGFGISLMSDVSHFVSDNFEKKYLELLEQEVIKHS